MSQRSHTPPTPQPAAATAPPANGLVLSDQDLYLFNEGSHFQLYDKLGAHAVLDSGKVTGTSFAVWAPNAREVYVMGEFNGWNKTSHPLHARGQSGIWQGVVADVGPGTVYKYHIVSHHNGYRVDKADPIAFFNEEPPRTGSVVWQLDYDWQDSNWMANRHQRNALNARLSTSTKSTSAPGGACPRRAIVR